MWTRLAALALCCVAAVPARAGVTLTLEGKGGRTVIAVEGSKARVEHEGQDGRTASIFDGERRTLLILDHAEQTYLEMTEADLKVMSDRMKQAMAAMPPEQRQAMQGVAAGKGRKTQYQSLGRGEKVAGHACTWYRQQVGGRPAGEGCYIPWRAGVLDPKDFAPFVKMSEIVSSMAEAVGGPQDVAREIQDAPGFPAIAVEVSPDGAREEERLVEIVRGAVPADRFRPPAAYRKTQVPK